MNMDKKDQNVKEEKLELVKVKSEAPEDNFDPEISIYTNESEINDINLVEKFKKALQCILCYEQCQTEENLNRHNQIVHKNDQLELRRKSITLNDMKFSCEKCPGVKFLTSNIVNVHAQIQHRDPFIKNLTIKKVNERKECKLCRRRIKTQQMNFHLDKKHNLEKHLLDRNIEEKDLQHKCKKCMNKFVSQNSLGLHKQQHNYKSKFNSSEFEYLKKSHYINGKFKCNLCYRVFTAFSLMVIHINGWHKQEKQLIKNPSQDIKPRFTCQECNMKFLTRQSKFVHRLFTHYNLKNNYCNLCEIKLASNSFSIRHNSLVHRRELKALKDKFTEEDKLKFCNECGKKYYTEGSLSYHMRKEHSSKRCSSDKTMYKKPKVQTISRPRMLVNYESLLFTCYF